MSTVVPDLVKGRIARDTSGWTATRVYNVTLDAGGNPESAPYRATQLSSLPKYGDPHPAIPGITVSSIDVSHDEGADGLHFEITIQYGGDAEGTAPGLENSGIKSVDVNTSMITVRSYRDIDHNLMKVRYEGPEIRIGGNPGGMWSPATPAYVYQDVSISTPQEAEYEIPAITVQVTREKNRPSHVFSRKYAGLTNSDPWSGLPANNWLCIGIDSSLNSTGTFDWRYIFAAAPKSRDNETWLFRAEPIQRTVDGGYALRLTNTVGNGIEFFRVYASTSFRSAFGFEIPH